MAQYSEQLGYALDLLAEISKDERRVELVLQSKEYGEFLSFLTRFKDYNPHDSFWWDDKIC